jgi:hypothetical protein
MATIAFKKSTGAIRSRPKAKHLFAFGPGIGWRGKNLIDRQRQAARAARRYL